MRSGFGHSGRLRIFIILLRGRGARVAWNLVLAETAPRLDRVPGGWRWPSWHALLGPDSSARVSSGVLRAEPGTAPASQTLSRSTNAEGAFLPAWTRSWDQDDCGPSPPQRSVRRGCVSAPNGDFLFAARRSPGTTLVPRKPRVRAGGCLETGSYRQSQLTENRAAGQEPAKHS